MIFITKRGRKVGSISFDDNNITSFKTKDIFLSNYLTEVKAKGMKQRIAGDKKYEDKFEYVTINDFNVYMLDFNLRELGYQFTRKE